MVGVKECPHLVRRVLDLVPSLFNVATQHCGAAADGTFRSLPLTAHFSPVVGSAWRLVQAIRFGACDNQGLAGQAVAPNRIASVLLG